MDLDPTRCRRTDGKKWRCRNDVVPNEKYCQKHMHRGSKRSRKLVEASKTVVDMNENPNSNLRVRFPASLILGLHGNKRSGNVVEGWKPAVNTENVNRESILANAASVASSLSDDSRFGRGSSTSQPGRCIRTDGQRWRCSRDVLPHQKYCTLHIHRGSKKLLEATTLGSTELQEAMPCSHNLVVKSSSDIVAPEMKKHVEATTGGEEESSEATVVDDGSDVSNMLAHSP